MKWTVFGERLLKELEKKQLSYRQFAEMAGITTTTVCRYANCERVPRAREIIKTSEVLGVTCDYLLGLSDDPHKTSMSYVIAQPEIIRCGECRHKGTKNCVANTWATIFGFEVRDDFYCGLAKRRTDK